MGFGLKVTGGDQVAINLRNASESVQKQVNDLIQETGINIEADAKQACPVDTGRLRASIKYTPGDMQCTVDTNVEYAEFVEYGTVHMDAQPFLYPAFDDNVKRLQDALKALKI